MTKIWQHSTQRTNKVLKRLLIGAILICFLITLCLTTALLKSNIKDSKNGIKRSKDDIDSHSLFKVEPQKTIDIKHRLAVIVPFRDRFEELVIFTPFIHRYLNLKNIDHDIVIVNQVDDYRFNRASLINIGFLYATNIQQNSKPCDYIVMHDVDLLPLNNDLPYNYPVEENKVVHVAGPGLHPKYDYPTFIGGILVAPVSIFGLVNGMSNVYWGWGLEDDEFYVRLKQNNIQVIRPNGLNTGKTNTFRHAHIGKKRPRDMAKCFDQWKKTRRRDRITGLNNVNYTMESITHMKIEEAPLIMLNVKLHCNLEISPWCDCAHNNNTKPLQKSVRKISAKSS